MLTIRLQRIGKKGQPSYRLVVAERRSKVGAPPTEDLGAYNPFTKKASFKADRVKHWLGVGAQATVSVHNLLVKNSVIEAPKRAVYMKQAVPKAAEEVAPPAQTQASSAAATLEAEQPETVSKESVTQAPVVATE